MDDVFLPPWSQTGHQGGYLLGPPAGKRGEPNKMKKYVCLVMIFEEKNEKVEI